MPLDLLRAIQHANKILDWYENLTSKDMPPDWMWSFDKRLNEWFDRVKEEHENPSKSAADDRTVVPLMENEEAKGRRG